MEEKIQPLKKRKDDYSLSSEDEWRLFLLRRIDEIDDKLRGIEIRTAFLVGVIQALIKLYL